MIESAIRLLVLDWSSASKSPSKPQRGGPQVLDEPARLAGANYRNACFLVG